MPQQVWLNVLTYLSHCGYRLLYSTTNGATPSFHHSRHHVIAYIGTIILPLRCVLLLDTCMSLLKLVSFLSQGNLMDMFVNFLENQDKTNFVLTVFFILLPTALLSLWSLYIHVTQPDIIPFFKNLPYVVRLLVG